MRNSADYKKYLALKEKHKLHLREATMHEKEMVDSLDKAKDIKEELKSFSEYDDLDINTAKRLMSSVVYDSVKHPSPMVLEEGALLVSPIDDFKQDTSEMGYGSLNDWQKEQFVFIDRHIRKSQLSLKQAIDMANDVCDYDIDECDGIVSLRNEIILKHPDYENLNDNQIKQLKEIFHKFVGYLSCQGNSVEFEEDDI